MYAFCAQRDGMALGERDGCMITFVVRWHGKGE